MRKFLKLFVIFVTSCFVAACAPKPRQILFDLDFTVDQPSSSVIAVSGLSGQESWGRWTDAGVAPTAKIRFDQNLPRQFAVTITGQSMPEHESAELKIGSFKEEFFIHGVGDRTTIHVELTTDTVDTIEIIPTMPLSPKEIGLNADNRKLGIGLMKLVVETYEK